MNAPRVVCAQVVLCIGGGNKECSRTARGLHRWQSHFSALALQYLPPCVICCHRILADDKCVGIPEMLGAKVGATLINRGHRITDGEAKLVAERRNTIQVGDAWVAGLAVQFCRPLNRAIKILQYKRDARQIVILENGKVDHKVALACKDLSEIYANRAKCSGLLLKAKAIHIGGDAADAAAVIRNGVTGALQITVTALPHHNLARLDAGLLQPLADSQRQRQMGCDGLAAQAVNLEAD